MWGRHGGGDKSIWPIMYQQLSRFVHVTRGVTSAGAKHDHSWAPSARTSPDGFYAGLTGPDLKNSCVPTERGPSRFDRVWYIGWCSADACVIRVGHGSFTLVQPVTQICTVRYPQISGRAPRWKLVTDKHNTVKNVRI